MSFDDPKESDELRVLRDKNQAFAGANYAGRVSLLRAKVIQKLSEVSLDPRNLAWMYFLFDPADHAHTTPCPPTDILVLCETTEVDTPAGVRHRPALRFLQSEMFPTDLGSEYLTTDVVIDTDGDAQYAIGSTLLERGEKTSQNLSSFSAKKSRQAVDNLRVCSSSVPFFRVNVEGELETLDYVMGRISLLPISADVGSPARNVAMPFGDYRVQTDLDYSLEVAQSIFNTIKNIQPERLGEIKDSHDGS